MCSISCSRIDRGLAAVLVATLILCSACAARPVSRPRIAGERPRVALLPLDNLAGATAPTREIHAAFELELARAGLDVVSSDRVDEFLARHRIRYTGGIDGANAEAAREELEVDGVVVAALEAWAPGPPPRLAMTARLIEADSSSPILWDDATYRTGDDAPGLLALGVVEHVARLQSGELPRLARSLAAFYASGRESENCDAPRRYEPKSATRSPSIDPGQRYTVAVLPFMNDAKRRNAGEIVMLHLVRQLRATDRFNVLEPGVVRDQLTSRRIVMTGGVSLENARAVRGTLGVDLVVAGTVREFAESAEGAPVVEFTIYVIDSRTSELVWHSSSYNRGDEGVYLFDLGRIRTASELTCRMTRKVAEGMAAEGKADAPRGRFREDRGPAPGQMHELR